MFAQCRQNGCTHTQFFFLGSNKNRISSHLDIFFQTKNQMQTNKKVTLLLKPITLGALPSAPKYLFRGKTRTNGGVKGDDDERKKATRQIFNSIFVTP